MAKLDNNNRKVFILVILLAILLNIDIKPTMQTVAPQCSFKEQCQVAVEVNYCKVEYDCLEGRCYSNQIRCPEVCYGKVDDDFDGLIDCKDPDCYQDQACPCEIMQYSDCVPGRCLCHGGSPKWYLFGDGSHFCSCG